MTLPIVPASRKKRNGRHTPRNLPLAVRLLQRVTFDDTGCWSWVRGKSEGGYGNISIRRDGRSVSVRAHRASYEEFVGPIPEGLVLDHLCRNSACINPAHLEPVTLFENSRRAGVQSGEVRSQQPPKHCPQGHETKLQYFRQGTRCMVCLAVADERAEQARREIEALDAKLALLGVRPKLRPRNIPAPTRNGPTHLADFKRRIVEALKDIGPMTAKDLYITLGVSNGHVYLGLNALERDGVVERGNPATVGIGRGAQYYLTGEPLADVTTGDAEEMPSDNRDAA